jgi:hypothetical protein
MNTITTQTIASTKTRSSTNSNLVQAWAEWADAGCHVHPATANGEKRPFSYEGASPYTDDDGNHGWGYKRIRDGDLPAVTLDQFAEMVKAGEVDGFGVFCGQPSGNLEMLEVEGRAFELLATVKRHAAQFGHGAVELLARVANGCVQRSPSGGVHFLYRVDGGARGNVKLARRPDPDVAGGALVLAETRGQGGWFVAGPSGGRTHRSGKPYKVERGSPATIPTITAAERDTLYALFRMLDEMPPEPTPEERPKVERKPGDPLRPGDDYNERVEWDDILIPAGWTKGKRSNGRQFWRRPGKSKGEGCSATTTETGFYCFSTSAGLPTETPLSKFAFFAHSHHQGNFRIASTALRMQGYGDDRNTPPAASVFQAGAAEPVADQPAIVGEVVPYKPKRSEKWGNLTVEMRWSRLNKQVVTIHDGDVVTEVGELKIETLSAREKFVKKAAKRSGGNADELDRLLVTMASEGCPPPPAPVSVQALATPVSYPDEIDGRPAVVVGGSGQSRSTALDRCQILVASEFYQADESLVSVDVCSNRGTKVVRKITVERLAAWLDTNVAFYGIDSESGEPRMLACPDWLSRRMFNLQAFAAIRPVNGIATGPFMRPDGSIGGYQSGYDDQTGVVVSTSGEWPTISDRPTLADAQAAVDTLLDAVKTFPFRGRIDRSVWLASVLTTVARRAFFGPAPMFVATAPLMGAGKSLLQQAASWIATGTDAPAAKLGNNDVENEKVIGAILAERPTCLVFDNVAGTLGDPTVDRMLTADVITTRQLGQSSMITVRNAFVAFANGNNLTPKGDIGRRILHMRLEPDNDRPHETQHKADFRETIMARRRELLAAALTILRYGMTMENPPTIRRLGSFGRWGAVVQTALVAVGQPDPAESQGEMLSDAQDIVGELVAAITDAIPDFRDTAARLVERAFERNTFGVNGFIDDTASGSRLRDAIDAVVEQHRGGRSGRLEDMRATIMLRVVEAIRDRWFGDCRLVRDTKSKHGRRWKVERRGDAHEPLAD